MSTQTSLTSQVQRIDKLYELLHQLQRIVDEQQRTIVNQNNEIAQLRDRIQDLEDPDPSIPGTPPINWTLE